MYDFVITIIYLFYNIANKVTQFQPSHLFMSEYCAPITLRMHTDDAMKPLKCIFVTLSGFGEPIILINSHDHFALICDSPFSIVHCSPVTPPGFIFIYFILFPFIYFIYLFYFILFFVFHSLLTSYLPYH